MIIPSEDTKILKINPHEKSDRESLKNSSIREESEHITTSFTMSTISSFSNI